MSTLNQNIANMKITILEDQHRFVAAIIEVLPEGHQVVHVMPPRDFEDCLRAIEKSEPDILLLDHNLDADYTGEEVFRRIDQEKIRVIGIASEGQKYIDKTRRFSFKDHLPQFGSELVDLL